MKLLSDNVATVILAAISVMCIGIIGTIGISVAASYAHILPEQTGETVAGAVFFLTLPAIALVGWLGPSFDHASSLHELVMTVILPGINVAIWCAIIVGVRALFSKFRRKSVERAR